MKNSLLREATMVLGLKLDTLGMTLGSKAYDLAYRLTGSDRVASAAHRAASFIPLSIGGRLFDFAFPGSVDELSDALWLQYGETWRDWPHYSTRQQSYIAWFVLPARRQLSAAADPSNPSNPSTQGA